ncbi:unnamed protein product [Rhodiola kirilowii]
MSSSKKFVQPAIPKFDGHFDHWSMLMENFLRSKEMWNLVEEGIPVLTKADGTSAASEADEKGINDAKLRDMKVKNYLFQVIDREILETILDKSTSKAICESMKKKYEGSTKVKRALRQELRREYKMLSMKEGEKVDTYLARTLMVVNKLKANGDIIPQDNVVSKVLRSLTSQYNYIVCSIIESNDLDTMTIDELQGSLLVHEQTMLHQKEDEQVLKVTTETNNRGRGRGPVRGRGRGRTTFYKSTVQYFKCEKMGHYQSECPEWENDVNFMKSDDHEEMVLMAYAEKHHVSKNEVWYLDSGCSNHMSGNKHCFYDLDESFRHSVALGNNTRMPVMGRGDVKLIIDGSSHVMTNVYWIPDLQNNLISIGQIQEKGLIVQMKDGACSIYHPEKGLVIHTPMSPNRMYTITAKHATQKSDYCNATIVDKTHLWHCRFGHLSYKGLAALKNHNLVNGLPNIQIPEKKCRSCLVGKQHREVFSKKSSWRASRKLQLIHSDLCGPITPESSSRKRYIISFIDDFSSKCWVYFLTKKSQTFETFKKFKAAVERETGLMIQCLRTDRGGEYNSKEFKEYCDTQGIRR